MTSTRIAVADIAGWLREGFVNAFTPLGGLRPPVNSTFLWESNTLRDDANSLSIDLDQAGMSRMRSRTAGHDGPTARPTR